MALEAQRVEARRDGDAAALLCLTCRQTQRINSGDYNQFNRFLAAHRDCGALDRSF